MKLDGAQIGTFKDILCEAFTRAELTIALRTDLDFRLDVVISTELPWEEAAHALIDRFNREERAVELVRVVRKVRPFETKVK